MSDTLAEHARRGLIMQRHVAIKKFRGHVKFTYCGKKIYVDLHSIFRFESLADFALRTRRRLIYKELLVTYKLSDC